MTEKQRQQLMAALRSSGVFVTCGIKRANVMTTHWGCLGTNWNKDVFLLPVRGSKLSHEIIGETRSFAVSVPIKDMRNEIAICDHISGFTVNKFEELHLHPKRAKKIDAYILGECGLIVECKIAAAIDLTADNLSESIYKDMYAHADFHTLYIGEIVEAYNR